MTAAWITPPAKAQHPHVTAEPTPVGVADATANLYSLLVVATLAATWWSSRHGRPPLVLLRRNGLIVGVVAVGVLFATVPAVLADHDHTGHEVPAGHHPVGNGHHDDGDHHG